MAKITIGGTEYIVPELSFAALERAWPFVEDAMVAGGDDPMRGPLAALRIIAAGFVEDENFQPERFNVTAGPDDLDKAHDQVVNFFRRKLKAREMGNLKICVEDIVVEAGLVAEPGEIEALGEAAIEILSRETAAASSQSSLPQDAKAEAGTA